jgi:hypothetical protein
VRLFLLCALAAVLACEEAPLDRKRLYAAMQDLSSVAAEARMLVVQARRGLPASYVDGLRQDLVKQARDALRDLDRGTEDPALEPARRAARRLGEGLGRDLEASRDPAALDQLSSELAALAARAVP